MPSVNNKQHDRLLREVTSYVQSMGFITDEMTYHDNTNKPFVNAIRVQQCIPSHVVRTKSDRLAVRGESIFWYDAKTCRWITGDHFAIEAVPFLNSCIANYFFNTRSVYCCRREDGSNYGVKGTFPFLRERAERLIIPDMHKRCRSWQDCFRRILDGFTIDIPIMNGNVKSDGSRDPFLVFNVDHPRLSHWKDLVRSMLNDC